MFHSPSSPLAAAPAGDIARLAGAKPKGSSAAGWWVVGGVRSGVLPLPSARGESHRLSVMTVTITKPRDAVRWLSASPRPPSRGSRGWGGGSRSPRSCRRGEGPPPGTPPANRSVFRPPPPRRPSSLPALFHSRLTAPGNYHPTLPGSVGEEVGGGGGGDVGHQVHFDVRDGCRRFDV